MLTAITIFTEEELPHAPFYYTQNRLTAMAKVTSPSLIEFRSALLNAGYDVSLSHANKLAVKTNAPNQFIWDMIRAWEKKHPANREKMEPNSVAFKLLNQDSVHQVNFCCLSVWSPLLEVGRYHQGPFKGRDSICFHPSFSFARP